MSALAGRIRAIPSWQLTLGVALLLLGFLIAAQLAAEGPRVRYTSQERTPLVETALALQDQQDQPEGPDRGPPWTDPGDREDSTGSQAAVRTLNSQLEQARIAAGLIPLTGTGSSSSSRTPTSPCRRAETRATISSGRTTFAGSQRALEGRRGGRRDQRRAHHHVDRDHRHRRIGPRQRRVPRRSVPGQRHRSAGAVLPTVGLARVPGVRQHPARLLRDRDVLGGARRRRHPGVRRPVNLS